MKTHLIGPTLVVLALFVAMLMAMTMLPGCATLDRLMTAPAPAVDEAGNPIPAPDPLGAGLDAVASIAPILGVPLLGLGASVVQLFRQHRRLARQKAGATVMVGAVEAIRQASPAFKAQWKELVQKIADEQKISVDELTDLVTQIKRETNVAPPAALPGSPASASLSAAPAGV